MLVWTYLFVFSNRVARQTQYLKLPHSQIILQRLIALQESIWGRKENYEIRRRSDSSVSP